MPIVRHGLAVAAVVAAASCAPRAVPAPEPTTTERPLPRLPVEPPPPPEPKVQTVTPADAHAGALMPVASTGAWAFRQANPESDGRGVLIAILDSGIDPSVPGLGVSSTGDPKAIDVRDFSGEGRVALAPVTPRGDSITIGRVTLGGFGKVASLNPSGPFYGGVLREQPLGKLPASDLNGDGSNRDELPVLLTRATDGWVVFADTDGDGTLEDERPVRDYLEGRETIGWTTAGRPAPIGVAVNVSDSAGVPVLDLVFDTSSHGTHVAGIASGAGLYAVEGFDGVAPGASIIGLKIANNAHGGISVTGSMIDAMTYAIRFAERRSLPLVMNLSFGVGNELEGTARVDALIDSVLAANPNVILVTSAGNDGPGVSTMGFPASASRAITVGATLPASFVGFKAGGDVIAFFSARGGELSKPDIVAPGVAYSSVPRWSVGDEIKNGTSMAAPQVSGAVALLLSHARREKRTLTASLIKQALEATARPVPNALAPDQGAGLVDVVAADSLLRRLPAVLAMRARIGTAPSGGAYRLVTDNERDSTVTLTIEGGLAGPVTLEADSPWLEVPKTVTLTPPSTTVPLTLRATSLSAGLHAATVTGWASDRSIGALFRSTATLIKPEAIPDSGLIRSAALPPAGNQRIFFQADTARPFRVTVKTASARQGALAFLHEPGGQPNRTGSGIEAGPGTSAAEFEMDGRDIMPGIYEAIAAAMPGDSASTEIRIDPAPVALGARRIRGDSVTAWFQNRTNAPVAGSVMLGLLGAERHVSFSQRGSVPRRVTFLVPKWARRVVVELNLPPAEWSLFTDLGLSVMDSRGELLEDKPMNYAVGRLELELPETMSGQELAVVLLPGLADPKSAALWQGDLSIRLYAPAPVLVPTPASDLSLAPHARAEKTFALGKLPWTLGDGFFPLGSLVLDAKGALWGREIPMPEPAPPVMR